MSFAPVIIVGPALFYCLAMVAMKSWWTASGPLPLVLVVGALICRTILEILQNLALRQEWPGMVYVAILGAEVIILAGASMVLFHETFSLREVAGLALVVAGTALARAQAEWRGPSGC